PTAARRAAHSFLSESLPCSPRDDPRAPAASDSPHRAGAALAPASRTRSIGRARQGPGGGGGGGGSGSGGGISQVSASLDSLAFRRAVREEAEAAPSFLSQVWPRAPYPPCPCMVGWPRPEHNQ
ncbi:hypothetical protein MNEG_15811, partial [Monoraphidium neglectum]